MEYSIGRTGRVVGARLYEGEDVYACIEGIARREDIRAAAVWITGGFRRGDVVVGPKTEQPRIEPDRRPWEGPGEVLGVGTLYWEQENPCLHLHAGLGKRGDVVIGCPRGEVTAFLILEVTMIELLGVKGQRVLDPETGFHLLHFTGEQDDGSME